MLDKFKADEDAELAKQQRIQDQKNHYIENIKGQKEEREALYEREKAKELAERDHGAEMEEYRLRVVAEARKRLLAQHAEKLKGFMPKGTVVNDEEAAIVAGARDVRDHTGRNNPLVQASDGYPDIYQYKALAR